MSMIVTQGLTRRFGNVLAVDHLDLEINEGEIFGLLGPNGAGKTTTVRMLSSLIAPSAGQAWLANHQLGHDNKAIRQNIGLLTETPGLYEKLDAYTNLKFYAELYQVEDVDKRVQHYLHILDLWGRHQEPVARFSKGMKQKLAIARALVHEPRILFLDEPTSGLDPQAARTVREFIEDLRGQGRTILLCTHNLDEAERMCDRIAVLNTKLVAVDTPDALRRRLFGQRSVIRLKRVTPEMVAAVCELDAVSAVENDDDQIFITLQDPDEDNPAVVRRLVELGGEIQQVTEQRHSLEEVYLNLIGEAQDGMVDPS